MVSFIIPVYNVEKYLRDCLDSVLSQSYTDFEVIMIDDGSTDHSAVICEEYAAKDPRFFLLRQENKGPATARNTGVKISKGEFIFFLDSDDCINSSLLEIMVSVAEEKKANIVQTDLRSVSGDFKAFNEPVDPSEIPVHCFSAIQAIRNLDEDNKKYSPDIRLTTLVLWSKLYRKSAFQNLLLPEGMYIHEDQMVAHRWIAEAGGVVFLGYPLYYYRRNDTSLIRTGWNPKRIAMTDCYRDRLKCVEDHILSNPSAEGERLADFISWRYFVCLFRNYDLVCRNLSSDDGKNQKEKILTQAKDLLRNERHRFPFAKRCFIKSFCMMPMLFQKVFHIRNRIRKKG